MTYSFTQISQYLRCPRQYRYRYLDGWREREDRASMIFGRCFENALAAYFKREDPTSTFFKEWLQQQDAPLAYTKNDSWDRLYHQAIHLLERFAQDDRVQIRSPKQNLQVKLTRSLPCGGDFVSYVDAIGEVDGTKCIIDWKRPPPDIRNNRRVFWLSIRNSFATPGWLAFLKLPWSYLCERTHLRFSI